MTLVIDANVIAALLLPLSYSNEAEQKMRGWIEARQEIISPILYEYEMDTILRKAVHQQMLTLQQVKQAWIHIQLLNISSITPSLTLHEHALSLAEKLGQSKVYDAHYVALADIMSVPLWTGDLRLTNAARQAGLPWVHWIAE